MFPRFSNYNTERSAQSARNWAGATLPQLQSWSDAPTVTETIEQAYADFPNSTVLKMVADDGRIIGSVRGKADNGSLYIGRLMVLPEFQKKGYGKILLREIQSVMPNTDTLSNGHTWISMEKIRL